MMMLQIIELSHLLPTWLDSEDGTSLLSLLLDRFRYGASKDSLLLRATVSLFYTSELVAPRSMDDFVDTYADIVAAHNRRRNSEYQLSTDVSEILVFLSRKWS